MIPSRASDEALNLFKFDAGNEHEADRIAKYVAWQCTKDGERVTYLEKVKTEMFSDSFGTCLAGGNQEGRRFTGRSAAAF